MIYQIFLYCKIIILTLLNISSFSDASGYESVCSFEVIYNHFIMTTNRTIPIIIALYRYVYVFYSNFVR